MMKATHSGHCQACGRLQKLPKGRLSLHGYNVAYGFFSGICRGARYQPYELSKDLLQLCIDEAQSALDALRATQAKLRAPATESKAWIHEYHPSNGRSRSYYAWELKDISTKERPKYGSDDADRVRFIYVGWYSLRADQPCDALDHARLDYADRFRLERDQDILGVCTILNSHYADSFEGQARSLKCYIEWQTGRLNNWQLLPLLPVNQPDDKQGFQVEE